MIDDKTKNTVEEISDIIDNINVDDIKSEGLSLRLGNRLIKLEISEESMSVEDEIKKELKEKLHSRIEIIRERVNEKITDMYNFVQNIKNHYDSKEKDLSAQLENAVSMPDIDISHARNGLSVVKGNGRNRLRWLVQGIFWPKYVDKKPLDKKFSKKMLSNVVYVIETHRNDILNCHTCKPIGLTYFQHYHQNDPDCWGNWNPKRKWNEPYDIIKCAREAEAVLENVNTASVAKHNPVGLPRESTLLKYVLKDGDEGSDIGVFNQSLRRTGITKNIREDSNDMWTTTT